jgi:hypothetical protein
MTFHTIVGTIAAAITAALIVFTTLVIVAPEWSAHKTAPAPHFYHHLGIAP